jgi:hypothetical protein
MAEKRNKVNQKDAFSFEVLSDNGSSNGYVPPPMDNASLPELVAPAQDLPCPRSSRASEPLSAEVEEALDSEDSEDLEPPRRILCEEDLFLDEGEEFEEEEPILTSCPCRPPRSSDVFRVRPGKAWRAEVFIVDYRGDNAAIPHGNYVIARNLERAFKKFGRKYLILTCVTGMGQMFLWPIKIVQGLGDSWYKSDLRIAKDAETHWLRFLGSDGNAHQAGRSKREWGEPRWQGENLFALVNMAFDERIVSAMSHPLCHQYEIE